MRLFRKIGEVRYASLVLSTLLVIVASQGDEEMVRSVYQQSLPLMQQARNPGALGLFLINNGEMWLHSYRDEPLAQVLYRLGLSLWQDMQQEGQGIGIVKALAGLAEVAAAQGKAERAGRLFGAAAHLLPSDSLERQDVNGRVPADRKQLLGQNPYALGRNRRVNGRTQPHHQLIGRMKSFPSPVFPPLEKGAVPVRHVAEQ